ncbi:MAG: hypothetical protein IJM15_02160 [Erysipelotrichaceae bacterium]|nr:hypothetical protein [Erysipelotrichaceae bacterium]
MIYYLKEEVSLIKERGAFYDENENEVYTFYAENIMHPVVHLCNGDEEIGTIRTRRSFLKSEYDLYVDGQHIDTLKQVFSWLKLKMELPTIGWKINNEEKAYTYNIMDRYGRVLASIKEGLFHLTMHFSVEIFDEESEELLLLVVLGVFLLRKAQIAAAAAA